MDVTDSFSSELQFNTIFLLLFYYLLLLLFLFGVGVAFVDL